MLFGTSFYKLELLHYQNRQRIINSALSRATKNVKNRSSWLTKQKRVVERDILYQTMGALTKNEYINMKMAENNSILAGYTAGEVSDTDMQKQISDRAQYGAEFDEARVYAQEEAETICDEESDSEAQAFKQEEEDLTVEKTYVEQMIQIVQEKIKQAEQWFKDSMQMLFGGHGH